MFVIVNTDTKRAELDCFALLKSVGTNAEASERVRCTSGEALFLLFFTSEPGACLNVNMYAKIKM